MAPARSTDSSRHSFVGLQPGLGSLPLLGRGRTGDCYKDWIGGYYEPYWSANPYWTADFKTLPDHPVTRGVKPFAIYDHWYIHMRFRDDMAGVTPILTAVPPDSARSGPDGPHSGNPTIRAEKGEAEHVAWARVRPDGGRGFGITGCSIHWNWGNDDFRTLVLNAIAWVAQRDVPPGGVPSKAPSLEMLEARLLSPSRASNMSSCFVFASSTGAVLPGLMNGRAPFAMVREKPIPASPPRAIVLSMAATTGSLILPSRQNWCGTAAPTAPRDNGLRQPQ